MDGASLPPDLGLWLPTEQTSAKVGATWAPDPGAAGPRTAPASVTTRPGVSVGVSDTSPATPALARTAPDETTTESDRGWRSHDSRCSVWRADGVAALKESGQVDELRD